jgi:hypothetical protein
MKHPQAKEHQGLLASTTRSWVKDLEQIHLGALEGASSANALILNLCFQAVLRE